MVRSRLFTTAAAVGALVAFGSATPSSERTAAQPSSITPAIHARQARRMVIKNAMVIVGNAKPAYGPVDITVDRGIITALGSSGDLASGAPRNDADTVVIDASGKYVMPGIV